MKGTIALSTVKAVEPVDDGAFGRGFCFQVLCLVEVTVQASIITSEGNKYFDKSVPVNDMFWHFWKKIQVIHDELILYIVADSDIERKAWMEAIQDGRCYKNNSYKIQISHSCKDSGRMIVKIGTVNSEMY